ncbi:glycosyltransferase family 4 protein [Candidatus Woesearchaeota archaeon]|nr:glycosyltransferase family 4 protein [Candidatus Woesearchaeota archaeon]
MRFLFVLENYLPHLGGAEIAFKNLTERLVKEGNHVDLVTHRIPKTALFEQINGVNVYRVRCFDSRYLFSFFSIPKIFKLAKRADIIQTTTFNGAPPAWFVGKLRRKPIILTVHEVWINKWREVAGFGPLKSYVHDVLERCIYHLPFTRYACVSEHTRQDLIRSGINEKKTITIYNGLDYDFWNPAKFSGDHIREKHRIGDKFLCFSWGRIGPSKGFEYAIRAIPLVAKKIPNVLLMLMVSNTSTYPKLYKNLLTVIEQEGVDELVTLVDSVPYKELGSYIVAADCIIIPSVSEGFGYTTAESAALKRPIVASNVCSIPEIISGDYALVPSKDPQAIADGIIKVHEKKTEHTPLKRFDWDSTTKAYMKLYQTILDKNTLKGSKTTLDRKNEIKQHS